MLLGFALVAVGVRRGRTREVLAYSLTIVAIGCAGFVWGDDLAVYFVAQTLMPRPSSGGSPWRCARATQPPPG